MPATMSQAKSKGASDHKHVTQPHKKALLTRIKRIEGQVRGVAKMVEEDRYCVDVLNQIAALRSALDAVALRLLEDHTKGCVSNAILRGEKQAVDELLTVLKHFTKF